MTTAYDYMLDDDARRGVSDYLWRRQDELEKSIKELTTELRAINVAIKIVDMPLCDDCCGVGKFYVHDSHNEGHYEECESCGGAGYNKAEQE